MGPKHSFQNVYHLALLNHQQATQCSQLCIQINQRFAHEEPLPVAGVFLSPVAWFNHVQTKGGAGRTGAIERLVIGDTKISFEPDNLQGHG